MLTRWSGRIVLACKSAKFLSTISTAWNQAKEWKKRLANVLEIKGDRDILCLSGFQRTKKKTGLAFQLFFIQALQHTLTRKRIKNGLINKAKRKKKNKTTMIKKSVAQFILETKTEPLACSSRLIFLVFRVVSNRDSRHHDCFFSYPLSLLRAVFFLSLVRCSVSTHTHTQFTRRSQSWLYCVSRSQINYYAIICSDFFFLVNNDFFSHSVLWCITAEGRNDKKIDECFKSWISILILLSVLKNICRFFFPTISEFWSAFMLLDAEDKKLRSCCEKTPKNWDWNVVTSYFFFVFAPFVWISIETTA